MSESASPRFAVVVATRNRGRKIVPLLESVLAGSEPSFEMAIVDQSTNDETRLAIEPFLVDQRIKYVHSSLPGTSRARNAGAAMTTAPILVITDDDCLVPVDWLTSISAPFALHAQVGVVFCNVKAVPVDKPGHTPQIRFPASRAVESVQAAWANSRKGLSLGAGMAVRRKAFEDVQGFDIVLGPGATFQAAEDNDLAWRALVKGWWVFEDSDTTVMHDGFRSLDELRELIKRDFYGVGGTIAKYIKSGHWQISGLFISWALRFGVIEPARELLAGKRPRGFRRPYMLARGMIDGLRRPVDTHSIRYSP
ncbi:MAG: glycosyltransferase [Polyangiaceae bacterium]